MHTKALLMETFPLLSERNGHRAAPRLLRVPGQVTSWLNFWTAGKFGPWFCNQTRQRAETRFHQADRFVRKVMVQIMLQMLTILT